MAYRFTRKPRSAIQLATMIRRAENKLGINTAKGINTMKKVGLGLPINIQPWILMKEAIIERQETMLDMLEEGI